jgi:murein DD-endopeptidase MepM/ murein hydrolase activator NlpD
MVSPDRARADLLGPDRACRIRPARHLPALLAVVLALVLQGCAAGGAGSGRRVYTHVVARGETAWLIAQRYGTTVDALARTNRLRDPGQIAVGQRLRVPARGSMPRRAYSAVPFSPRPSRPDAAGGATFRWPVEGPISSGFGRRWLRHHDGIDIAASSGTPVRAAARGRVVHSGQGVTGYGNLVIINHEGATATVYAHNRRNLVRVGEWVEQGEVIAEVGQTGHASGPHLHFEVRRDGQPQNPLQFLP